MILVPTFEDSPRVSWLSSVNKTLQKSCLKSFPAHTALFPFCDLVRRGLLCFSSYKNVQYSTEGFFFFTISFSLPVKMFHLFLLVLHKTEVYDSHAETIGLLTVNPHQRPFILFYAQIFLFPILSQFHLHGFSYLKVPFFKSFFKQKCNVTFNYFLRAGA